MPIIKSAKKRVRVAKKQSVQNAKTKKGLKASLKAFHSALTGGKTSEAQKKAQSAIDKAAKKGVVSKNKAARQKRKLNAQAKAASGVSKPKAAPKKAVAKKPAAKKAAPKKAAAKKTAKKK